MRSEEIKAECEQIYKTIRVSEERLNNLRKECKHEKFFIGDYSFSPGHIYKTAICEYCGQPINTL